MLKALQQSVSQKSVKLPHTHRYICCVHIDTNAQRDTLTKLTHAYAPYSLIWTNTKYTSRSTLGTFTYIHPHIQKNECMHRLSECILAHTERMWKHTCTCTQIRMNVQMHTANSLSHTGPTAHSLLNVSLTPGWLLFFRAKRLVVSAQFPPGGNWNTFQISLHQKQSEENSIAAYVLCISRFKENSSNRVQ